MCMVVVREKKGPTNTFLASEFRITLTDSNWTFNNIHAMKTVPSKIIIFIKIIFSRITG
jgi:hypothetical protein